MLLERAIKAQGRSGCKSGYLTIFYLILLLCPAVSNDALVYVQMTLSYYHKLNKAAK